MDFFTYSEVDASGNVTEISEEELKARLRDKFFAWMFEVAKIAGWTNEQTADKLSDPSWFFCYDDGLTPETAYAEAKMNGVV